MYYCEFAATKFSRHGTMLPAHQALASGCGYSSLYQFRPEDAKLIRLQGHSRGLKQFPVYSDTLWIDIDDDSPERARQRAWDLCKGPLLPYSKKVFFSGKKGYHIGVNIEPMLGIDVPYSQKKWVEENEIQADMSLYQHGRLFRNVGALHESSGLRKELVFQTDGEDLRIPLGVAPTPVPDAIYTEDFSNADRFRASLWRMISIVQSPPAMGMRHTTLWSLAAALCESGASYDFALTAAYELNRMFEDPKDDEEVRRAVDQGYDRQVLECAPGGQGHQTSGAG